MMRSSVATAKALSRGAEPHDHASDASDTCMRAWSCVPAGGPVRAPKGACMRPMRACVRPMRAGMRPSVSLGGRPSVSLGGCPCVRERAGACVQGCMRPSGGVGVSARAGV